MVPMLFRVCLMPLFAFSLSWSLCILLGMWVKRSFRNMKSEWRESAVQSIESSAANFLIFGVVYLSALCGGFLSSSPIVRWVLLGLMTIAILAIAIQLLASADYGFHKVPKGERVELLPNLFPAGVRLLCSLFCGWWMLHIFLQMGL